MYDEFHSIKKDANAILSMFYYLLELILLDKKENTDLIIFCDNSAGQNKNQYIINNLIYFTKTLKLFNSIEINYLIAGHSKFSPDRNFGTLKKYLKSIELFSILNIANIIINSAENNKAIIYKDPITKKKNFECILFMIIFL